MKMHTQMDEYAAVYSLPVEDASLAAEGWMRQTDGSLKARVEISLKTSGSPMQTADQRIDSQSVPGIAGEPGYSRARLRQIAGRAELLIDSIEFREEPVRDAHGTETGKKEKKKVAQKYSIPLEFAGKGVSWTDYEAGKAVEFRFSKQACADAYARAKLEASDSSHASAWGTGKASLSISVKSYLPPGRKSSEYGRVVASQKRIDIIHLPVDTMVNMKVSY